nr:reverse transcriptase domain-containing protein [Tanacetum cinerariifolium]
MPTYRTTAVDVVNNDDELRLNLDLLEECRELAAMNEARSKSKMMKYYNSRVRGVAFKPGDFVYRNNNASHAVAGGKLGPKWEGPYEVTDALGNEAYKLRSTDGTMLPRMWNTQSAWPHLPTKGQDPVGPLQVQIPGHGQTWHGARSRPRSSAYYAASLFLFSTTDIRRNSIRQLNLFLAYPRIPWVTYLWIYRDSELRGAGAEVAYKLWSILPVIPAEIGMPTYRTTAVDAVNNDEELRLNLDLLEERREFVAINEASNDASHAAAGGKLGPKWEGPYEVTDVLGNGAYKLRSMDGTMLPRTWNVANLKRCYL